MTWFSPIWRSPRIWVGIAVVFGLLVWAFPTVALPLIIMFFPMILVWLAGAVILFAIITTAIRYSGIKSDRISVEDRLDELERLKCRDMVTPEEYAAKRQEILKDL